MATRTSRSRGGQRRRRVGVGGAPGWLAADEQRHQPAQQDLEPVGRGLVVGPGPSHRVGDVVVLVVVAGQVGAAAPGAAAGQPVEHGLVGPAGTRLRAAPHQLLEGEGALDVGPVGDDRLAHVLAGHADDQRRRPDHLGVDGLADVAGDVDAAVGHDGDGVVGGRGPARQQPGGRDVGTGPVARQERPEHALGHGRSALVGRADEEDVDGWSVDRGLMASDSGPDPRSPVIVGVGQWNNRVDQGEPPVEPADMMAEALRRAADDSGGGAPGLTHAGAVPGVQSLSRPHPNPARLVAERVGATPRDEAVTPIGGNEPQALVAQSCRDIAAGDAEVVLICGAEAWRTRTAGTREPLTAEQIRTPSPDNRWIWWPYTKVMNANNAVEQAAALILCSVELARALGVPRDRWVFPRAATQARDTYVLSHRLDLRSAPALGVAGRRLFSLAGAGVDDVAHVDLYSCFPSAVQVAAAEIGLSLERPLTVTGGLSFAGGPWNNYVTHAIAPLTEVLRRDPGSLGLVTGLGGYLTKHALGLYSTEPPVGGFRWADAQDEVEAAGLPRRALAEEGEGDATIESWVVEHGRDGEPRRALAACLLDDGRRAWASSEDPDTVAELRSGAEQIGRAVKIAPGGTLSL